MMHKPGGFPVWKTRVQYKLPDQPWQLEFVEPDNLDERLRQLREQGAEILGDGRRDK